MEEVHEIVKEIQESPQWLMKCYQPEVYFTSGIEDKNKKEFVEVNTLSLTRVPPSCLQLQVSIVMPLPIQVLQGAV